jgi:hypothetical protein
LGFSADSRNPAAKNGDRTGPFYDFESYRLKDLKGNGFFSYLDAFRQQPYAYFNSGSAPNGYNAFGQSDCLSLGVWPYAEAMEPSVRYINPDGFQIICAGPDGKFGSGTVLPGGPAWTARTAGNVYPPGSPGSDDLASFHSFPLGKASGG